MGMDQRTPRLMAFDPRNLPVRSVDYWRNIENGPTQQRITRNLFEAAGRLAKQWDPRLWFLQQDDQSAPANLSTVYSLSAAALRTDSVDAGMQIDLPGLAGEGLRAWDGRGMHREVVYDDLLRPVVVLEQGAGQPRRCVERLKYGYPGQGDQNHNQYGQLIRHDDTAGTLLLASFALTGRNLMQDRRYIFDAALPDWPEPVSDREQLIEPGSGAVSTWRVGPLSDVLEQVDARGNRQRQHLTLDGRLSGSQLLLAGQGDWQTLVSDIRYDALGQIEGETAGNGVQTTLIYSPEDGRLAERQALRSGQVLQHLRYVYDPMGNVLSIEDAALAFRYFANQRIDPISRFVYDSLYQLIEATGWEAGSVNQGPDSLRHNDPAAVSNYQQTYRYDEGGNLLALVHVGAQSHGREIQAARYSNRCLPYRNGVPPTEDEIAAAFDARGNCLELDAGRFLAWDLRNQLGSVTTIERASGLNDSEAYIYDGGGQRVRKLRTLQTGARTLAAEVRYLPGLELRADSGTGEALQVITAQGGLSDVRVLHWESAPPTGENDCYRYSVADHLGSVGLELAQDGRVISREHYYPFGETAYLAGEDVVEVGYKTVRYSGKERDATGFYYYGYRYYMPGLQRWLNPDPAGAVDGLNLYWMTRNNSVSFIDDDGAVTRKKLSNGLWSPVIAVGAERNIPGAQPVDIGTLQRNLPAAAKTTSIHNALTETELNRVEVTTQLLNTAHNISSELNNRQGGAKLLFTMEKLTYSGASSGALNALRVVENPRNIPEKNNAILAFWAPQGGYVDIPVDPGRSHPDYVFTPGFSGCSLTVDQLNDNVLRVRHVQGGKESAEYNDLPGREHGLGLGAMMEYMDYGYALNTRGQTEEVITAFAFMKFDRGAGAWKIFHQSTQGAASIESYSPGRKISLFNRSNASVTVFSKTRVRKVQSKQMLIANR
ncbi:RHS repeat protein [Pseudomonas hefeiensis]|uniref:RHS repeat protein n=1 Tax=Pseudomonas hefeiensis TaxID=2738125 RepID=A0ABY9GDL4_9PSED|nr:MULTISPECIES: RHS repeat-associated core domain-containing protein [unclassified Pseudomonas]WLH13745.1 RHS repeat protein [Pseudomonas sp. FP205]WLH96798.1 RHS repeat protein [Pseudomonas sp. FP53]WLI41074.1 RHS repeat protein [Pseudomonas sp. FP821]